MWWAQLLNNIVAFLDSGAPAVSAYMGYITPTTGSALSRSLALDASNVIHIAGQTSGSMALKLSSDASAITWQKRLTSAGNTLYGYGCAIDSSGNFYEITTANIAGNSLGSIYKYNSSGTLQWQRTLSTSADAGYYAGVLDSTGSNVFTIGLNDRAGTGYGNITISKWSSAGTLQWQKKINDTAGMSTGNGICIDSSGNLYGIGYTNNSPSKQLFIKRNSSGTIQFQREISNANNNFGYAVATDSSNCYTTGQSATAIHTCKYSTSGTLSWTRLLTPTSGSAEADSVALDSLGNVYIAGWWGSTTNVGFLAKYNSSGTLQWQRTFTSASSITLRGMVISGSTIYLSGNIASNYFYAAMPTDGSKIGTFTVGAYSITIAAGAFTDAASGYTDAIYGGTEVTPTSTEVTPTYTDAATTFTITKATV